MDDPAAPSRATPGRLALAFALVYLSWGTTYLAIQEGMKTLPPGLFGGVRITCAGLVLMAFLKLRGQSLALPGRELAWAAGVGLFLFVGGNGLINAAEKTVPSGVASVLVATTPLWSALLEMSFPGGERLRLLGWLGLFLGLAGVLVMLGPKLETSQQLLDDAGPFLVLGSAFTWALGAFVLRVRQPRGPHLVTAAYQMVLGGAELTLLGVLLGEVGHLTPEAFTPGAVLSFFHLLVFGSLVGYLSFTWLLRHVSATLAGTYAYVNPLVALLVGALLAGEPITVRIVLGMVVILAGVALVRQGRQPHADPPAGALLAEADTDEAGFSMAGDRAGKITKMGL
jgi:drug/metabolite transporter (DMT)-like permease